MNEDEFSWVTQHFKGPAFVAQKSGIGRKTGNISSGLKSGEGYVEFAKGMTNLPQNLLGAPMDISNMVAGVYGGSVDKPFMGSEYLKEKTRNAGLGFKPPVDPALSGFYGAGDLGSNLVNPAGATRAGLAQSLQAARLARQAAMQAGRGGKAVLNMAGEEMSNRLLSGRSTIPGVPSAFAPAPLKFAVPPQGVNPVGAFDPRFDPRVNEQNKLRQMVRDIEQTQTSAAPNVSLANFEGRPFITTMSDRTAGGANLVGIDAAKFNRPVELRGGQDYMFNNPGQVWASASQPVKHIMEHADQIKKATKQNALLLPWRMAPSGGDFAAMTGETMLAYADSAMGVGQKKLLNKEIKKFIPSWVGVSDPKSVDQFRNAPDKARKAIKQMMDVNFRDSGGLNIGQARLGVADPAQLTAQEGGVMNVGEIFANKPTVLQSGHPSYPQGVPGQGLGTLTQDHNIFELLPEYAKQRGIVDPRAPGQTDLRTLQMKPYTGVITKELLKSLGY